MNGFICSVLLLLHIYVSALLFEVEQIIGVDASNSINKSANSNSLTLKELQIIYATNVAYAL